MYKVLSAFVCLVYTTIYPLVCVAQDDAIASSSCLLPYNHGQHEVHQFIEKIRQTKTLVRNELSYPIKVKFRLLKGDFAFKKKLEIPPSSAIVLPKNEICLDLKVYDPGVYINLEEGVKRYSFVLSKKEAPYRPDFIPFIDFKPVFLRPQPLSNPLFLPYSPTYYQINLPTNLKIGFQDQYDGHLRYLFDCLFRHEEIDGTEYFSRLNRLFETNSMPVLYNRQVAENNPLTLDESRIPPLVHSIWLTHKHAPIEFPEEYAQFALDSAKACPPEQGYKHILWVESKKRLPETVRRFSGTAIHIREIKELGAFELKTKFKEELVKKRFGRASDIIRIIILSQMGGVYRDTDYRIHQSLYPLLASYDFFGSREPMSSFICNAFFGAAPGHSVIETYKSLIERNYDPHKVKKYIASVPETDCFGTILITGPGAFTTAVAKSIGLGSGRDIILPEQYIYPTPVDRYPQLTVIKPGNPVPPTAFGAHYWLSSWTHLSNFGSKG